METPDSWNERETIKENNKILNSFFDALNAFEGIEFALPQDEELSDRPVTRRTVSGTFMDSGQAEIVVKLEVTYTSHANGVETELEFGEYPNTMTLRVEFYSAGFIEGEDTGLIFTDVRKNEHGTEGTLPRGIGARVYANLPIIFQEFVNNVEAKFKHVVTHDGALSFEKWIQTFEPLLKTYTELVSEGDKKEWVRVYEPESSE